MADSNTVHVGPMAPQPNYDVRLVTVERDVAGLKQGFDSLSSTVVTGFDKITTKIEAKSSPNWHVAALCLSIFTFAVGAIWILFSTYSAHVEQAQNEQKASIANFMKRDDIVALSASAKEIADLKMQIVQKDVTAIGKVVEDLQSKIVPLSTHEQLWKNQADVNKTLLGSIDENRKAIGDISAPKDTISRINKRLDDIELLARDRRARPGD